MENEDFRNKSKFLHDSWDQKIAKKWGGNKGIPGDQKKVVWMYEQTILGFFQCFGINFEEFLHFDFLIYFKETIVFYYKIKKFNSRLEIWIKLLRTPEYFFKIFSLFNPLNKDLWPLFKFSKGLNKKKCNFKNFLLWQSIKTDFV